MNKYTIKMVEEADSPLVRKLASMCSPLDVHTPYTYWVVCAQFGSSCFIMSDGDREIGFITSIRTEKNLFIWQIGIVEDYRDKGLAKRLIREVFEYAEKNGIRDVLVTISGENKKSYNAFASYCRKNGYSFEKNGQLDIVDYIEKDFEEQEDIYVCHR